jgi:small subunit ribosomal protein S16
MLTLKLQRVGKKHQAFYRLVADEKRHKMGGNKVDYLGWYNPHTNKYEFKKERILHWLKNGAQKTDTVHNLLIKAGIISGKKIAVHKKAKSASVNVTSSVVS